MLFLSPTLGADYATTPAQRGSLLKAVIKMTALYKQRRDLARLTSDQLADIGVSAAAAREEANRSVWDIPQSWRG